LHEQFLLLRKVHIIFLFETFREVENFGFHLFTRLYCNVKSEQNVYVVSSPPSLYVVVC